MNYCTAAVHILVHSPSTQGFPVRLRKIASSCFPSPTAAKPPTLPQHPRRITHRGYRPHCVSHLFHPASLSPIVNKGHNLPAWLSIFPLASAVRCEAQHNSLTVPYFVGGVRCLDRTFLILSTNASFLQHIPDETVYPLTRSVNNIKPSDSDCSKRSTPQQSWTHITSSETTSTQRTLDLT